MGCGVVGFVGFCVVVLLGFGFVFVRIFYPTLIYDKNRERLRFFFKFFVFCGTGKVLTVVLFGYLITVSLLQLNLTIQRRSQAQVENFPPSEHICCCIKSLARNILSHKNNKQKDGPPSFEGRYTAFVNLFY